jgi:hypothetical protein
LQSGAARKRRIVERQEKLAENEALFRGANEKLQQYATANVDDALRRVVPFLCECDRVACTEVILVTLTEYERVRADSHRSILAKGHSNDEIENVVEESDGYVVTEKFGVAARVYDELDPRA